MSRIQNAVNALERPERFRGEHEVALKYLEEATPAEIADYEKRLRVVTASELLTMDFPPRECVLEPIIQTQGTMELYSKRGVGKTYFSLGIGCAVGAGASFLRWRAPKPRKVLYVDGEMPAVTMRERLAAIISGMDADMDSNFFRLITPDLQPAGMPSLSATIGQTMIEDQLDGTELLILDNLSTLCRGGKENEAESWLPIQEWVLSLRRRGVSVLFDHHAGKGGAQRGTSRREDVLDTVIALRHSDDYNPADGARFEVHFEKARNIHGHDVEPFEVRMETRNGAAVWLMNSLENVTEAKAKALFADGMSISDVAKELGIHRSKSQRLKAKFGGGNV
jgi:putative DNA primase/helicase